MQPETNRTLKREYSEVNKTAAKLKFRTQAFIAGQLVDAPSGAAFTTENPATGKPLAEIAAGGDPEVDRAGQAARKAFESGVWSRQKSAQPSWQHGREAAVGGHTVEVQPVKA